MISPGLVTASDRNLSDLSAHMGIPHETMALIAKGLRSGECYVAVGSTYGIPPPQLLRIRKAIGWSRTWRWRISEEHILRMGRDGVPYGIIGEMAGVSAHAIHQFLHQTCRVSPDGSDFSSLKRIKRKWVLNPEASRSEIQRYLERAKKWWAKGYSIPRIAKQYGISSGVMLIQINRGRQEFGGDWFPQRSNTKLINAKLIRYSALLKQAQGDYGA